jgi:hypothetical protein
MPTVNREDGAQPQSDTAFIHPIRFPSQRGARYLLTFWPLNKPVTVMAIETFLE